MPDAEVDGAHIQCELRGEGPGSKARLSGGPKLSFLEARVLQG